jgi:RNA polymerase sigma factor (sigma-70 family)
MTNSVPEEMLLVADEIASRRGGLAAEPTRAELAEVLFRRHYAELLRLAVVMLGGREAAEDVVQEAFVSLHRHRRSLRDPTAGEAYLRSAVLNGCRSWVRRQVTRRAPRPQLLIPQQHESPEDTAVGRADTGSLVALMRTLPRRQREALACRFVLEMSVAETAHLLEISEGSVKTHTHRGLQALQRRIEVDR